VSTRDVTARLRELEQILSRASDAFATLRDEGSDGSDARRLPAERIRRLTLLLRSYTDGQDDAVAPVAVRMLLDEYAMAVARLRATTRTEADRLGEAAATLDVCQKLLWRERKLASKEARRQGEVAATEDTPPVELAMVAGWSRSYGTPRESAAALRFARYRRFTAPHLMRWLEGLEVVIVPGEQVSQAVYVSGLFEPCTAVVLRALLREGDTFVDVGANVGLLTMLAARWVGRSGLVVSVEPSSREFARLQQNLAHNALDNVRPLQAALGSHDGTARLRIADARHGGHNTLRDRFVHETAHEIRTEGVPLMRLDDHLAAVGVQRVRVIKIDVEGSEPDVLAGATGVLERDRPVIILAVDAEASEPGQEGRLSLENRLRSLGYVLVAIDAETPMLRRIDDFTAPAENFLAAPPEVAAQLARQVPIAGLNDGT